jgi:Protein of unknown function (DUF1194)
MSLRRFLATACATLVAWSWCVTTAIPEDGRVDLALALAVDVSFSVDAAEHRLQMEGFAAAISSDEVMRAVHGGRNQRIAVTVYQWSDEANQRVIVPWTVIASAADAEKLALVLSQGARPVAQGGTAISAALFYGAGLLHDAPPADRKVIDLATDGRNNMGRPVQKARDFVTSLGITINGLAVSNEWRQLSSYLESQVVGGDLSFVEEAKSYDDFGAAMLRKLVREITGPGVT